MGVESFGGEEEVVVEGAERIEDIDKAKAMAHEGDSARTHAASFRQAAKEASDYREKKLSDPMFLQKPKEGEADRGQFAGLLKQREEGLKHTAELFDMNADSSEEMARKKFEE